MKFRKTLPGKAFLAIAAAGLLLVSPGCRSLQVIPGQRLTAAEDGDGRFADFSKKITCHLFENGLMVGVGNDDRYLYVFFSPDIRHRRRPPSRASLTLWLDENGGKAEKLGLVYVSETGRHGVPGAAGRPASPGEPAGQAAGPQAPAVPAATVMKILERTSGKETFISAEGSPGPAVRLADDWGDFAYQWRIPLRATAGGEWPGLASQAGKPIGIGLQWEIAPLPGSGSKDLAGHSPGAAGPGFPGGDEMGPPPGGMAGGRGGPGRGMARDDFKSKRRIWLKTALTQKS